MAPLSIPYAWLKAARLGFVVVGAIALLFSYTVNLWTERKLPFIESALSRALEKPVEIRRAGYNLFLGFVLDDFSVKEMKSPVPLTIGRVRAIPTFEFVPRPKIRIHKLIFERPRLGVYGSMPRLFRAGILIRKIPRYETHIGMVDLEMKLEAFEIKKGTAAVLSPESKSPRQEFEGIDFFAGRGLIKKNAMVLRGHIAGKPEARFRVECDMLKDGPGALNANIRLDLNEFTSAYLKPYVGDRFKLPEKNLTASVRFKIRGSEILSQGKIYLPSFDLEDRILDALMLASPELSYQFRATLEGSRMELRKIQLRGRHATFGGEGSLDWTEGEENYRFSLSSKEISLEKLRNLIPGVQLESGQAKLALELSGSPESFRPSLDITFIGGAVNFPDRKISLTKIDGSARFSPKGVECNELWFFANDFPLRVSGNLRLSGERPWIALEASTFPGQVPSLKPDNPVNAIIVIRAGKKEGVWNGFAKIRSESYADGRLTNSYLTLVCKALSLEKGKSGWLLLRSFKRENERLLGPLAVRRASFKTGAGPERVFLELAQGQAHGGKIALSMQADLRNKNWRAGLVLTGIHMASAMKSLPASYPLTGTLSLWGTARGDFKAPSEWSFKFKLADGSFGPNPSMTRWAEQTGIDALKQIRFGRFLGDAGYQNGEWTLQRLRLSGPSARFRADLKIKGKKVSGKLSARFPTGSIRKPSDLDWLLRYVGQTQWVDFDFQVAGKMPAPRIRWLTGEFKRKIQARLAPWMQRELSRQLEKKLAENRSPLPS